MPAWVEDGFGDYARRMPAECRLELVEVAAERRSKRPSPARFVQLESSRLLGVVPKGSWWIALDERGELWNTQTLASQLERWMGQGADPALLVGGPDGLDSTCRKQARQVWSLSPLTLPHMLVRVLVAEQLYRAWSIIAGHPYHRG